MIGNVFLSNGDKKTFANFLKALENEKYCKYTVSYVIICILDYVRTFAYFPKNSNCHKKII